jgi:hypothetical protein
MPDEWERVWKEAAMIFAFSERKATNALYQDSQCLS